MLVDLTQKTGMDPFHKLLVELGSGPATIRRLQQGVYAMTHWNPEFHFVEKLIDGYDRFPSLTSEQYRLPQEEQDRIFAENRRAYFEKEQQRGLAVSKFYQEKYGREWTYPGSDAPTYGVVDTPQQLLELFPHLADDDVPRAITMVEIRREDQPGNGGWRYHKWGEYLGNQNPQHEYIADDKHIEAVWTFHIYGVEKR